MLGPSCEGWRWGWKLHMQTQLGCANARTRVEARIRFNTGSPFKNTRFCLSHTHTHTHTHTGIQHFHVRFCCMLMLIISQGRLMTWLSARQGGQMQVLRWTTYSFRHNAWRQDPGWGAAEPPRVWAATHEQKVGRREPKWSQNISLFVKFWFKWRLTILTQGRARQSRCPT